MPLDPLPAHYARAICAMGQAQFPENFLSLVRTITRADMVSAFEVMPDGNLRYLFAAGMHPDIPGFAVSASLAYAKEFWRRDRVTRQALATPRDQVRLVRQAASSMADSAHRHSCYERGGITERITLYGTGPLPVIASAYRTRGNPLSHPAELDLFEAQAQPLLALVRRHAALAVVQGQPDLESMRGQLLARCADLSEREATVAAAMALGRTQPEIAESAGLKVSSIVTYRRRAYRKLGVSDRRRLLTLLQTPAQVHGDSI